MNDKQKAFLTRLDNLIKRIHLEGLSQGCNGTIRVNFEDADDISAARALATLWIVDDKKNL